MIGNITVVRYTGKPNPAFRKLAADFQNISLDNLVVKTISLIYTNAGCAPEKTKILGQYNLN